MMILLSHRYYREFNIFFNILFIIDFSVFLPCNGNTSGTAMVKFSLSIHDRKGMPMPGTPLRLNFKKGCAHRGVYESYPDRFNSTLTSPQGIVSVTIFRVLNLHKIVFIVFLF